MSENVYLLSVGFNQDYSCFACGTTAGFRVFTMNPFNEAHRRETDTNKSMRPFKLCTMLFKTNLFAVVEGPAHQSIDGESPNPVETFRVRLWDDSRDSFVAEIRSRHDIKGVYLRRDVICVVSEYNIYGYRTDQLNAVFHISTVRNPKGICALVPDSSPWIIACPGNSIGSLRIQIGPGQEGCAHEFAAHKTSLAYVTANQTGELFATASEMGTVIKVFDTHGNCLHELRRGTQAMQISCLTFRKDNKYLACASSSATVHIFELHKEEITSTDHTQAAAEKISDVITAAMPKYFHPGRAAAIFRIPDHDHGDLRALSNSSIVGPQVCFAAEENKFYVLHYTGLLYEVRFDVEGRPPPSQLSRVVAQVGKVPGSQHLTKVLGEEDDNCTIIDTTTWFASRPEFQVYRKDKPKRPAEATGDEDGEWNVL